MKLRVLNADTLRRCLSMSRTIEAMKRAFAAYSSGAATVPQRITLAIPPDDGVLLIKPALLPNEAVGAKLVSAFPGNTAKGRPVISGLVILFDETTGEPMGLCDGGFLTAWRTGAASGAATDLLARHDARIGAVIGCGVQGRTQALAISAVRSLEEIRLFDLNSSGVDAFVEEMTSQLPARLVPVGSVHQAVAGADVICTATTATEPVIRGEDLSVGAHLNGVGSFTPSMREVDGVAISRARIVVDSREAARAEAGELIRAMADGLTRSEEWVELGEIVNGARPGRESDSQLTFFKSVGLAVQDVAAAALAFTTAADLGLGEEIDLS
jgi:ornithine cyclodeaminase/alanine dehydrogenase-like protein (mu-crystallin family)